MTPASQIKPRPVRWMWQDRVPAGALTLLPGREGIGKSLALVWLTAQLTRGMLPGIHHGHPRPVIYAASEDSWAHTVVPRLMAAGADLHMVYRADVRTERITNDQRVSGVEPLTLPRDNTELTEEIKGTGVAMLALDPLMSVIGSAIDTHRDRELRTALDPLTQLADDTGAAVVGLSHFNKAASSDPLNLITGSRAFSAVARAVVAVARDPDADDGSCVMSQAKNNLGRLDLPHLRYVVREATVRTDEGETRVGRLVFLGESARGVDDVLGDTASGEDRTERDEAAEWLRAYLTDPAVGGEAPATEIYKAAGRDGIAQRTLQRARSRVGVRTTPPAPGRPSVWSIDPTKGDTQ
ncbi:hypothetical protein BJF83_13120 [Nocardiopsis sp. CNR-923]|uniref:AAA family ATPase n=1 Tax=Nocardiopsis sp. CNR-923 TaxID=1904965 RepID=UPI000961FA27|nr:AAA family ATPase [Nocardiopsis sp. CNR-923]OLT29038.1 hypothetical protein BJF83_13120 [Nocardiopsis sp. CNR-923]